MKFAITSKLIAVVAALNFAVLWSHDIIGEFSSIYCMLLAYVTYVAAVGHATDTKFVRPFGFYIPALIMVFLPTVFKGNSDATVLITVAIIGSFYIRQSLQLWAYVCILVFQSYLAQDSENIKYLTGLNIFVCVMTLFNLLNPKPDADTKPAYATDFHKYNTPLMFALLIVSTYFSQQYPHICLLVIIFCVSQILPAIFVSKLSSGRQLYVFHPFILAVILYTVQSIVLTPVYGDEFVRPAILVAVYLWLALTLPTLFADVQQRVRLLIMVSVFIVAYLLAHQMYVAAFAIVAYVYTFRWRLRMDD